MSALKCQFAAAALLLCGCEQDVKSPCPIAWRDKFIAQNEAFLSLSNALSLTGLETSFLLVNVGSYPNAGDGDCVRDALDKTTANVVTITQLIGGGK